MLHFNEIPFFFLLFFSMIWRNCDLVGLGRKKPTTTDFPLNFYHEQNKGKFHFSHLFSSPFSSTKFSIQPNTLLSLSRMDNGEDEENKYNEKWIKKNDFQ